MTPKEAEAARRDVALEEQIGRELRLAGQQPAASFDFAEALTVLARVAIDRGISPCEVGHWYARALEIAEAARKEEKR